MKKIHKLFKIYAKLIGEKPASLVLFVDWYGYVEDWYGNKLIEFYTKKEAIEKLNTKIAELWISKYLK